MTQTVESKNAQQSAQNQAQPDSQAQSVEFSEAPKSSPKNSGNSLNMLLDMEVTISVNLGQTQLPIKDLLQMGPGSVLKLNRSVETPVDLYLKDSRFATGSIVVVEDKFAVKIEQLFGIDPTDKAQ